MPRQVNVIPGAIGLVELEEDPNNNNKKKDEVTVQIVPLEDSSSGLSKLAEKDPSLKETKAALLKNIGKRELPEVAESFLPGIKGTGFSSISIPSH